MRIPIEKHTFVLLNKRSAALQAAATAVRTANVIEQVEKAALQDVITAVSDEAGKPQGTYAGINVGEDKGVYFLELIEQPKAE